MYWKVGYEKGQDGIFRSMDDGSPLTEEQRATLEEICFRPTGGLVRVTREATPDFPATLPEGGGEFCTDYRLIAVLSVDHHPIALGAAIADRWAAATIASLHGGRLALYALDFSSPALTYTHFDLMAAPAEDGDRPNESPGSFTNGAVYNDQEAGHFATPEDEERILHAVAVEMALRANMIISASKRFAAETEGRRG